MKLLIVEDNKQFAATLKSKLKKLYEVDVAHTGDKGEYLAFANEYDAILLDLNLPDMDGREVCKKIRDGGNNVPILALTARTEIEDKVQTLDMGADDYLTKPFQFAELLARIRSLLRRGENLNANGTKLKIGELTLDISSQEVSLKGKLILLCKKELQLLEYLMRNQGRVVTRNQILEHVWDSSVDPVTNTVDVHINSLRKKIKGNHIKTVYGTGYVLQTTEVINHNAEGG